MAFLLICVLSLILGRHLAWAIARAFLYRKDGVLCALVCFTWANGLTFGLMYSVVSMHPGWFLKAIAFGVASYLSIPNYGLFDGNALPNGLLLRNLYIKTATPLVFVTESLILTLCRSYLWTPLVVLVFLLSTFDFAKIARLHFRLRDELAMAAMLGQSSVDASN